MSLIVRSFVLVLLLGSAAAATDRPHIVIILVDDMGYGDPGCFNPDSQIETPHLDQLARDGMRFTDAHAPGPLCHFSRYGLITGRYPFREDVRHWRTRPSIADGQTTIASLVKGHGYRTAMVGKWHLGFAEQGYDRPLPGGPIDCGFDSFFGIRASTDIPPYFYIQGDRVVQSPTAEIAANQSSGWSPIQGAFWRAGGIAPNLELANVLPRFTDESLEVIRNHSQNSVDPLMLYVAFPAPHTPWLPSAAFAGKSRVGMYGDFVMMVDAMIGRILASLEEHQMADNSLVIFASDNGPVWFPADVDRFKHDSCGGWRGMKADAWEAGHRMPFIVRWPGQIESGTTSDQLICFTDLLATFADILDVDLPADLPVDSVSFLPTLRGVEDSSAARKSLVIASGNGTKTVRIGNWKLIQGLGSGGFTKPARGEPQPGEPTGQLYDLSTDPAETNNVFFKYPQIVEQLNRELERQIALP